MRHGNRISILILASASITIAPFAGIAQSPGTASPAKSAPATPVDPAMRQMENTPEAKVQTGALKITYAGKSESWSAATLAALPHVTISVYNEHAKANQSYTGVPLSALLTRVGVPDKPHGKDFRLYLVAEGSDGYGVVYSVAEVTPDVHDATILVADAMSDKPLADSGPLQLVATGEKRPARWVRNLVSIRVLQAQ